MRSPRWFQDDRRNYILMFMDSVLFANAMTCLSVTTVIPYFIHHLGGGSFAVSLVNALVSIGAVLTQPFFTRRATRLRSKAKVFSRILSIQRVFLFVLVCTIPFLSVHHPHVMLILFLCGWGVFNLFVGAYSPFYMSLFAKMIAVQHRGKLRGLSGAVGNLLALLVALVIGLLLKHIPYPYNYTTVFVMGAVLLLLDAYDFALLREPIDEIQGTDIDFFRYIRGIPATLANDRVYALMVFGFSCLVISQVALVYYSLYAIHTLHVSVGAVAIFGAISVAGASLSSLLFGFLADKYSHRSVLEISSICGVLAGASVLGWHSLTGVCVAFAFSTSCLGGYNMSAGMLVIGRAPHAEIPMYISIYVLFTLILSAVVTLATSYVVAHVSFGAVFAFAAIAGVVAWGAFRRLRRYESA